MPIHDIGLERYLGDQVGRRLGNHPEPMLTGLESGLVMLTFGDIPMGPDGQAGSTVLVRNDPTTAFPIPERPVLAADPPLELKSLIRRKCTCDFPAYALLIIWMEIRREASSGARKFALRITELSVHIPEPFQTALLEVHLDDDVGGGIGGGSKSQLALAKLALCGHQAPVDLAQLARSGVNEGLELPSCGDLSRLLNLAPVGDILMDNRDDTLTINFSSPKPGQKPALLRRTMTRILEEILGMCGRQQVADCLRHGPGVLGTVTTRGVTDLEVAGADTIVSKTQCFPLSRIAPGLVDRHDRATLVQNRDAPRQQLEGNCRGGRDAQAAVMDRMRERHVHTVERCRRTGQDKMPQAL